MGFEAAGLVIILVLIVVFLIVVLNLVPLSLWISATASGIRTAFSPEHPENAPSPMIVTLSGIVMLVRPVQPLNALLPMLVTPFSISTEWISTSIKNHGLRRKLEESKE